MKFSKQFRGYNRKQVDGYIAKISQDYENTLAEQKERIFQLDEENSSLKEQVKQYKIDEQAISKSLVESQKLANELKDDAEQFAQLTLNRAKIFYATWQSYAKTMLNSLTPEEVKQFNALSKKLETVIKVYEGDEMASIDVQSAVATYSQGEKVEGLNIEDGSKPSEQTLKATSKQAKIDTKKQVSVNTPLSEEERLVDSLVNPIDKVMSASDKQQAVIDLKELLKPTESLQELCDDLLD